MILRSFDALLSIAENQTNYNDERRFLDFFELCAYDFFLSFLPSQDAKIDEYYGIGDNPSDPEYTDFAENFFNYTKTFSAENGEEFVKMVRDSVKEQLDAGLAWDQYFEGGTAAVDIGIMGYIAYLQKTGKLENGSHLLLLLLNVANIAWDGWNEKEAYAMYTLYRKLAYALHGDAIYNLDHPLGYITSNQLRKNFFSSLILHKFTYYSMIYLQAIAQNEMNTDDLMKATKRTAQNYRVTENGAELISPHFVTTAMQIPGEVLLIPFNVLKEVWIDGIMDYGLEEISGDTEIKDLNDYLLEAGISDIEEAFEKYDHHIKELITYERYTLQCLGVDLLFDDVTDNNILIDARLKAWEQLHQFSEYLVNELQEGDVRGTDEQNMFESIMFEYETGFNLMNEYLYAQMSKPITRKDFMLLLLKGAGYNPYEDEEFLMQLLSGQIPRFDDLDEYFSNPNHPQSIIEEQRLSLNEAVWMMYGRWKGIIKGDEGKYLNPLREITRLEAIKVVPIVKTKNEYI